MGLDGVELVMEIEARFNIQIPNEDAGGMETVGQVYEYLLAKLGVSGQSHRCGSAAAFYRLRRGLIGCLNVSRASVRPASRIDEFIPRCDRNLIWGRLSQSMDLEVPRLVRPRWMVEGLTLAIVVLFILALGISAKVAWNAFLPLALCEMAVVTALGVGAYHATKPFAIEFSEDCASIGTLAQRLLDLNFGSILGKDASRDEVWVSLVAVVVEQTAAEPDTIKPETSFVNDLGMD